VTGIRNEIDTFKCTVLAPNYLTNLVFVSGTLIADLTYLVGSPEIVLTRPSYTLTPADADVKFTFALGASTPSFITLVTTAGNPNISIVTTDTSKTGIYPIQYTVTEVFSNIQIS